MYRNNELNKYLTRYQCQCVFFHCLFLFSARPGPDLNFRASNELFEQNKIKILNKDSFVQILLTTSSLPNVC